jgi:hypothetical protein
MEPPGRTGPQGLVSPPRLTLWMVAPEREGPAGPARATGAAPGVLEANAIAGSPPPKSQLVRNGWSRFAPMIGLLKGARRDVTGTFSKRATSTGNSASNPVGKVLYLLG